MATDDERDLKRLFKQLLESAHIPLSELSDYEEERQNEIYRRLTEHLFDPRPPLVNEHEYSMAYCLSKIERIPECMIKNLTPRNIFLINYFVALCDKCSTMHPPHNHSVELEKVYVYQ
jgi:hypothetical protein